MSQTFPVVTLVRHGETEWSKSGRHTGRTDLPLTPAGEAAARGLRSRLGPKGFARVFTSPLQRAARTCELAGLGDEAELEPNLLEWDYGDYEGRTTADILHERPDWKLFRDGCPNGEQPDQVAARVDAVIRMIYATGDTVAVFSSAHVLRVLAARWLRQPPEAGRLLVLGTGSLSQLGFEHGYDEPVIRSWNAT